MEPQLYPLRPQTEASGAVIEASLWLRLGFFSGCAIVAGLLLSLTSAVLGAALAAFSVRRALGLLERESAAADVSGPASERALSQS
jgi:hypothetical protein